MGAWSGGAMECQGHQIRGELFDWKICGGGSFTIANLEFLSPQERRFLSAQNWPDKRIAAWIESCWAAKQAVVATLQKMEPLFRQPDFRTLNVNPELTECDVLTGPGKRGEIACQLSVGHSGEFCVALAWLSGKIRCGVDVKAKGLGKIFDSNWVYGPREASQIRGELCGQDDRTSQLALGVWSVIGWSLKLAAHRACRPSYHSFNPRNYYLRLTNFTWARGGEALVYPLESAWSGIPLRSSWFETQTHVFAFAYNDITNKNSIQSKVPAWPDSSVESLGPGR